MNFGELFIQSKGQPIVHAGKTLVMLDRVPADFGERFQVTIERTSSPCPQGVGVSDGVEVFGETHRRAVVWEYFSVAPERRKDLRSSLPYSFEVTCRNKSGSLAFYNMSEVSGRQEWWHGGSCMTVEVSADVRRYYCNDFELDDDFDDLVFSVTRLLPNISLQADRER